MTVSIECPGCGKNLKGSDDIVGKRVKCPKCGQVWPVPPGQSVTESSVRSAASPSAPPAAVPLTLSALRREKFTLTANGQQRNRCYCSWMVTLFFALTLVATVALAISTRMNTTFARADLASAERRIQEVNSEVERLNEQILTADHTAKETITATQELNNQFVAKKAEVQTARARIETLKRTLAEAEQKAHVATVAADELKSRAATPNSTPSRKAGEFTFAEESSLPSRSDRIKSLRGAFIVVDPQQRAVSIVDVPLDKLIEGLEGRDTNPQTALLCATAIGLRGSEAEKAVPALVNALEFSSFLSGSPGGGGITNLQVQTAAAIALGEVGPAAKAAIPALEAIVVNDDKNRLLRAAAKVAFNKMQ